MWFEATFARQHTMQPNPVLLNRACLLALIAMLVGFTGEKSPVQAEQNDVFSTWEVRFHERDPVKRAQAATELVADDGLGTGEIAIKFKTGLLVRALKKDASQQVRKVAAKALGDIGSRDKTVIDALIDAATSDVDQKAPNLRAHVSHTAKSTGDHFKRDEVQFEAIVALGKLGGEQALHGLSDIVRAKAYNDYAHYHVHHAASHALSRMGASGAPLMIEVAGNSTLPEEIRLFYKDALVAMGEAALPALENTLKKGSENERDSATVVVSKMTPKAAGTERVLLAALDGASDKNAYRMLKALALTNLSEPNAVEALFKITTSEKRELKTKLAAFSVLEKVVAQPRVIAALKARDWLVRLNATLKSNVVVDRLAALMLLGTLGVQAEKAAPHVIKLLTGQVLSVSTAATWCLGKLGYNATLLGLSKIAAGAQSEYEELRQMSVRVLTDNALLEKAKPLIAPSMGSMMGPIMGPSGKQPSTQLRDAALIDTLLDTILKRWPTLVHEKKAPWGCAGQPCKERSECVRTVKQSDGVDLDGNGTFEYVFRFDAVVPDGDGPKSCTWFSANAEHFQNHSFQVLMTQSSDRGGVWRAVEVVENLRASDLEPCRPADIGFANIDNKGVLEITRACKTRDGHSVTHRTLASMPQGRFTILPNKPE